MYPTVHKRVFYKTIFLTEGIQENRKTATIVTATDEVENVT